MSLYFTRGHRGEDVSVHRQPLNHNNHSFARIRLALAIFALVAMRSSAEDPWFLWARPVHDIASYSYLVDTMASDRQGNVGLSGIVSKQQGYVGLWFARYDLHGTEHLFGEVSSVHFGADGMWPADMSLDAKTNLYITGWSTPFTRYVPPSDRPQGTVMLFTKTGGSDGWRREAWNDPSPVSSPGSVSAMGVAVDEAGNSYVTGAFSGANPNFGKTVLTNYGGADNYLHGNGKSDGFIVKYDPRGTILWLKQFGGAEVDQGDSVGLDAQANLYVSGTLGGAASFDSLTVTGPGGVLAKYTGNGAVVWARNIDSGKLKVDPAGNCFVASTTGLAKYGANGQWLWRVANSATNGLALSRDSLFSLDGTTLRKYTLGGALLWSSDFHSRAMTADTWGNVYLGDIFKRTATVGGGTMTTGAYESIYLAKLGSEMLRLRISKSAGQLTASWSTNATGCRLMTSATIQPSNAWVGVSGTPSILGDLYSLPLPHTDGARFYRLDGN